ncbi:hypothetical protein LCI18_012375 [Fusarium solani-melongenae]|uniref:Uncharacterized protein n=1 Tax=Fusarium solani subsp. cucurbitae TaxID=2747967 RepID=A0ACD3ZK20_FUSSC|nr:hypothetical protein LCI18_012375 [Fusarium solani-melongenae]
MATAHRPRQLCAPCSALTFTMLRDGFTHPLAYRDTITSGETCALYRLMVCSTGKLSVSFNSYKMDNEYHSLAPRLPELPAISREESTTSGPSTVIEKLKPLVELNWSTCQYDGERENSWEVRKGNFNDDDESDWLHESHRMGTIFEEAGCIIAAVDSVDDNGIDHGLFLPRDTDPLSVKLTIPYKKNKLSWSCFTESGEEEGGDPKEAARVSLLPLRRESDDPIFPIWKYIISDYQCCRLTFSKDRLAAIDGISARLEAHFSCKIYAGILKAPLRAFNEFHAPSWTWLAFNGEISFFMPTPRETSDLLITRLDFKIRNQCEWTDSSKDCKGTCMSGSVSFEGPAGKLTRQSKLKDLRITGGPNEPIGKREILAGILGHALVPDIAIPPRFDELGNQVRMSYSPPVPDHTEILVD